MRHQPKLVLRADILIYYSDLHMHLRRMAGQTCLRVESKRAHLLWASRIMGWKLHQKRLWKKETELLLERNRRLYLRFGLRPLLVLIDLNQERRNA